MCGRFVLSAPFEDIRDAFYFEYDPSFSYQPSYNIAPSREIPIIRAGDTQNEMVSAHWGLIPSWSKEPKTKFATHNARIETVAEKPTYKKPFLRQRCLIPANGFYEWTMVDGKKVPHYIRMRDRSLFAFAGLWDRWQSEETTLDSCSIIVRPANVVMAPIHDRMPCIIAPAHYDVWLDTRIDEKEELMSMLNSAPSSQLKCEPVNSYVNSPKHDDERCISPIHR